MPWEKLFGQQLDDGGNSFFKVFIYLILSALSCCVWISSCSM